MYTEETIKEIIIKSDVNECAVLADWLEEQGDSRSAEIRGVLKQWTYYKEITDYEKAQMLEVLAPQELKTYDWKQVFAFAGEPGGHNCGKPHRIDRALPNDEISIEEFSRLNVKRIIAKAEGENDGAAWLIAGELDDGRFFSLRAWCDYTGFD